MSKVEVIRVPDCKLGATARIISKLSFSFFPSMSYGNNCNDHVREKILAYCRMQ
jgi:hypothetical protein